MRPETTPTRTAAHRGGGQRLGLRCRRGTRKRAAGFSLVELVTVVAILGILAIMLMPSMFDGLEKARQKRTMADIRFTGKGMMSWLTDEVSAAAAGAQWLDLRKYYEIPRSDLRDLLVPTYLQEVPLLDGWGHEYDYFLETQLFDASSELASLAIRSPGSDGIIDSAFYKWSSFGPTEYYRDIVWKDGYFVRFPSSDDGTDSDTDQEPGRCDQGVGNGWEFCDPGNSNQGEPLNTNDEPWSDNGEPGPGSPGKRGGNN